jgi:hypothetical protein
MDVHFETGGSSASSGTTGGGDERSGELRLVLRVRPPVAGPTTTVINRLGRLRAEGVVGAFDIEYWPDEVSLTGDGHPEVVATFERYEAWADEHGVSLRPAFDVRSVSPLIGERRELLRLPMACLAVHEDDDLVGVFPCTDGDDTWTVTDCLEAIAATGEPPVPSRPATSGT